MEDLPTGFVYGDHVSMRGKRYIMTVDKHGYAYYFFTRDYKKFAFAGRVWVGGVLPEDPGAKEAAITELLQGIKDPDVKGHADAAVDPHVKRIINFGTYGYFSVFKSYFAYSKHLESFGLDSHICVPGMNIFNGNADNGVKVLAADAGISGLLYALPESGDQLSLFMIDI